MDRNAPSALTAKDSEITLHINPNASNAKTTNVYSRALQEQERRRQVARGSRKGGYSNVNSFDGPAQWSQKTSSMTKTMTSHRHSTESSLDIHQRDIPDMMMTLPVMTGQAPSNTNNENHKVGWDDIRPVRMSMSTKKDLDQTGDKAPMDIEISGPAGSDAIVSRSDHAEPRKITNVKIPCYDWFTCNIANLRCGPSAHAPYVRFTGFFGGPKSEENAKRHIEYESKHQDIGQIGINSYMFPTKKIIVAGVDPNRCLSKNVADRKKHVVLESIYEWARERKRQFDENVKNHTHGKVGLSSKRKTEVARTQRALREKYPVPDYELERRNMEDEEFRQVMQKREKELEEKNKIIRHDIKNGPPDYPNELVKRGQQYVIVTVVPDESLRVMSKEEVERVFVEDGGEECDGGDNNVVSDKHKNEILSFDEWQDAEGCGYEPLFIAHTCAHDESSANNYSRNGVWQQFLDAETLTADMYQWLPLNDIENPEIEEHWFDAEQDLVMKRHARDQLEAQKFAEICRNVDKKMPVIDLTDPHGTGIIPAMKKGKLSTEELEQSIHDHEEKLRIEDEIKNTPLDKIHTLPHTDMTKHRTFIPSGISDDRDSKSTKK